MQKQFKALTLSYKTASVAVREKVALNEQEAKDLLFRLQHTQLFTELFIISTCNRTEIYYSAPTEAKTLLLESLCEIKKLQLDIALADAFTSIEDEQEASKHLFRVALGLESQVVGDMQIIAQVKQAYQIAADAGVVGPYLHRLLHTIFFANKRVVSETGFRNGAASVSYAAVELAEELLANVPGANILVLGLGEMGLDVARNLKGTSLGKVYVCNRTLSKAENLAEETGFEVIPFESYQNAVRQADLVISSVAAPNPVINKELVNAEGQYKFKFFIDLSVPRSIHPEVDALDSALVYNIDSIQNRASQALQARINCIPQVEAIMEGALEEFANWSQEMVVSPTINKLKQALEQIRIEELDRYAKAMDEQQAQLVDKVTKGIMQKIIKLPVLQLKAACKRGEAETLIDVLNDLFNLEQSANSTSVKE